MTHQFLGLDTSHFYGSAGAFGFGSDTNKQNGKNKNRLTSWTRPLTFLMARNPCWESAWLWPVYGPFYEVYSSSRKLGYDGNKYETDYSGIINIFQTSVKLTGVTSASNPSTAEAGGLQMQGSLNYIASPCFRKQRQFTNKHLQWLNTAEGACPVMFFIPFIKSEMFHSWQTMGCQYERSIGTP